MALQVNLSQGDMTRSGATPTPGENGDGTENGTAAENLVQKIVVYGFPTSGGDGFKEVLDNTKIQQIGSSNTNYTSNEPFKVAAGSYNVYVIANPSSAMENLNMTGLTETEFKAKEFSKGDFLSNTAIPMSSADKIQALTITDKNTKANPARHIVNIQRMLAKVQLKGFATTDGSVDFAQPNEGEAKAKFASKFEFKKYGVVNKRNAAYWFRRVGTSVINGVIGEKEDGSSNYVIDPKFDDKTSVYNQSFASINYWNREQELMTGADYWKDFTNQNESFDEYCFENTMAKEAQIQGYSTGIVLQAQFTPKTWSDGGSDYTEGHTFYVYKDVYYTTLEKVKAACPAVKDFDNVDDKSTESERNDLIKMYAKQGVSVYYQGLCYYHFWIRHANNNNNQEMGVMEFAIVRNNIYRMTVNSISGPGSTTPPVDPEDPDEDTETMLDVTVNVLPWVIRNNNMDL